MTSGKVGSGASGQEVRERNEGENRDAAFWGRQMEPATVCNSRLFSFKAGLPIQLLLIALRFLVICCFGDTLLHNKLFQNLNRS